MVPLAWSMVQLSCSVKLCVLSITESSRGLSLFYHKFVTFKACSLYGRCGAWITLLHVNVFLGFRWESD